MAIAKKVQLQLVDLDSNAFVLLGAFQKAAQKQGWTKDEITAVIDIATAGDYDHLLATLVKHTTPPEEDEE